MRKSILLSLMVLAGSVCADKYSGGDGAYEPWQIANLNDWNELVATPGDWSSHFVLTADLDLDGIVYTAAPIAPDIDNSTSGHQGTKFTGSINGQGHTIYNLTINAPTQDYVGLVGYTDGQAKLLNLTLKKVEIEGRNQTGGLIGQAGGWELLIENCDVSGSVEGNNQVGGLVGFHWSQGIISDCRADVTVQGNDEVGGFAGLNHGGTITDSYAAGTVTGHNVVGGLTGRNSFGVIDHCFATGQVIGNIEVGGLSGASAGQISDSYASGNVDGHSRVAGLTGANLGTLSRCYARGTVLATDVAAGGLIGFNDGQVANTYASGNVSAHERVGGLAGVNVNTISYSYSIGAVTAGGPYVGGLVGDDGGGTGTILNSFWDTETSGKTTSAGGDGKETGQMKQPNIFLDAGWDFAVHWSIGHDQTYPYLLKRFGADLNYDGAVNLADFAIFAAQWLNER